MALQHLFGIALRRLPLLVVGVLLPSVAAFQVMSIQPQVYEVSATLLPAQLRLAGDPDYNTVSLSRLVGLATYYSYTAKSPELLSSVGQQLNLNDRVEDLSKRVDATVNGNTAELTITARAGDASTAAGLANGVAHAVEAQSAGVQSDEGLLANLETARQRMLEAETEYQRLLARPVPRTAGETEAIANSLTNLRELTSVYDSLSASLNKTPSGLITVNGADVQFAHMIQPRTLYYTLLAAIAGLLIAGGIASILEYLDDTVKSSDDVEEVAGLRTLGTIALGKGQPGRREIHEVANRHYPTPDVAEAYRTLRTSIEFASADAPIRTLLVTSSVPNEGKTMTAANLAVAFAQAGHRVLLVDANLRKPGIHLVFDVPNAQGLTTLLGSDEVFVDAIAHVTGQANLRILTTGPLPPNPAELLGSKRMRVIVDRLQVSDDVVIFDGPALEAVTDSHILSSYLDATLFVIAAGRTRRGAVQRGGESLAMAHAKVLGAVLYRVARGTVPKNRSDSRLPRETPVVATRAGERANPI